MKTYVGIDPGLTGALVVIEGAAVDPDIEFHDTPTKRQRNGRADIDPEACAALLLGLPADTVVTIERAGTRPNQGVSSSGKFMFGFGVWIGVLATLGIRYRVVTPQVWKRAIMPDAGEGKDPSRQVARKLYPVQTEEPLSRKKDHGRADALLIAEYGRRLA